jgi:hypothetical protein
MIISVLVFKNKKTRLQEQGTILFKFRYEFVDKQSPRTDRTVSQNSNNNEELQKQIMIIKKTNDDKQKNDAVMTILDADKNKN